MHSNFLPWEFSTYLKQNPPTWPLAQALSFYGPQVEKILMDSLLSSFKGGATFEKKTLTGQDIKASFWEEHLKTLDLFQQNELIFILRGEEIPKVAQKEFFEVWDGDFPNTSLIICFSKSCSFFDELKKKKVLDTTSVVAPKFWENDKLLRWLATSIQLSLNPQLEKLILENISHNPSEMMRVLNLIKLHGIQKGDMALKELLGLGYLDKFKLASLFSKKRFHQFFKALLDSPMDYFELNSLFSFLQMHLLKIMDPAFIEKKGKKPNAYDKEILEAHRIWKTKELQRGLRLFGELQVLAKERNYYLRERIRLAYLATVKA